MNWFHEFYVSREKLAKKMSSKKPKNPKKNLDKKISWKKIHFGGIYVL